MTKYTLKEDVSARQLISGHWSSMEQLADWCNGKPRGKDLSEDQRYMQVDIMGVENEVMIGQWIVRAGGRVVLVCDTDLFEELFRTAGDRI